MPSFLSKVLSKELASQRGSSIVSFSLNPPTEKGIDKALKHIAECEDLCLSDAQLLEIRAQCNKDLRNAIVTLQFLAAGKTLAKQSQTSKRRRGRVLEESEDDLSQRTKPEGLVLQKDNPFTIFHALGKFLYNKSK